MNEVLVYHHVYIVYLHLLCILVDQMELGILGKYDLCASIARCICYGSNEYILECVMFRWSCYQSKWSMYFQYAGNISRHPGVYTEFHPFSGLYTSAYKYTVFL